MKPKLLRHTDSIPCLSPRGGIVCLLPMCENEEGLYNFNRAEPVLDGLSCKLIGDEQTRAVCLGSNDLGCNCQHCREEQWALVPAVCGSMKHGVQHSDSDIQVVEVARVSELRGWHAQIEQLVGIGV